MIENLKLRKLPPLGAIPELGDPTKGYVKGNGKSKSKGKSRSRGRK